VGARLGYGDSGVLHLLLAFLTAQIALGTGGGKLVLYGVLAWTSFTFASGGHTSSPR
jgi:hypothetical protein